MPFSVVSLLAQGLQQNGPATRPAASDHTLDDSAGPKSRSPLRPPSRPHTPRYCPPATPALGGDSDSRHQRQTLDVRPASVWLPGAVAQSATGPGTASTG